MKPWIDTWSLTTRGGCVPLYFLIEQLHGAG